MTINKTFLTLILTLILSSACLAEQPKLPAPPDNYSWKWCEDIKSAFLMPKGWHFKQMTKKGTYCCFIIKEDIDKLGKFDTGLTVNVIKDIPSKSKMSPSQYAQEYVKQAEASKKVLNKWTTVMGPFKAYGCLYASKGTMIHNLLIANDKTGSMYFVIFEAPEKEWKDAWKIGEPIMKKLLIDDEV